MSKKQTNPAAGTALSTIAQAYPAGELLTVAARSPAVAYIRRFSSDSGRRSMAGALTMAAEILAPRSIPASVKVGKQGNAGERFAAAAGLQWHTLQVSQLGVLRAELLRRALAPASINKVLTAVRGVLAQCRREHLITRDMQADADEELKGVKAQRLARGRHLAYKELQLLLDACTGENTLNGARDAALISLMIGAGLRRAEVVGLKMGDLSRDTWRLLVRGKGNKEREVWLTNGALHAVENYLAQRGTAPGALIVGENQSGVVNYEGITAQALYKALAKRSKIAGIECTPHDLRRTFAGDLLNKGVDISTVQILMGHSSPSITVLYDMRGSEQRRKAMQSVTIPYTKPA